MNFGKVYSTGGNRKSIPRDFRSKKEFLEDYWVQKRQIQDRQNEFWQSTSEYFTDVNRKTKMFDSWNQKDEMQVKNHKQCRTNLESRRAKLKNLLLEEESRLKAELNSIKSGNNNSHNHNTPRYHNYSIRLQSLN